MKKIFTFMIMILFGVFTLSAQSIVHYLETFDSQIPEDYKTYDVDGLTPASASPLLQSTKGKGWVWSPGGNVISTSWYSSPALANDWIVTKALQIPTAASLDQRVVLAWAEAKSNTDYPDGYAVYVSETDQEVASFTTKLLTVLPAETSTGFGYRTIDLSAYAGKTVYFAFVNNSYDGEFLYLDDIAIIELDRLEVSAVSVNNLLYNPTSKSINLNGTALSRGWEAVTNVKFSYQVDNGPVQTSDVSGLNIGALSTGDLESSVPVNIPEGLHNLSFWITEVNGTVVNGDTATNTVYGYPNEAIIDKLPIFEDFSSSTCNPCVAGNAKIKAVFETLTELPIVLKYQQDFPGNGDPYVTNETRARLDYYNIPGIPNSIIDHGFRNLNPQGLIASDVTEAFEQDGLLKLDLKYELDSANNAFRIFGTYTPTVDLLDGSYLEVAIKEQLTTKNKGTNGETSFDNVVKKMIPDQNGINVDGALANVAIDLDITYAFPGKYRLPINGLAANRIDVNIEHSVEEFTDLRGVVWIENERDNIVLNAQEAVLNTTGTHEISAVESFKVFPNPSRTVATVAINLTQDLDGLLSITDINGRQVWSAQQSLVKGANNIDLPVVNTLAVGTYNVMFRSGSKIALQELIVQ